jgi:Uma2 family endonuclease
MIANPLPMLTEEEYLALERNSEARHEYFRGVAYAMAGAKISYKAIKSNTEVRIGMQLLESVCRIYSSDQKVRTSGGLYAYPDILSVCGKGELYQDNLEVIINPLVLIEILSPSTAAYDRGLKFEQYKTISSLKEYLLIAQDRRFVEHYTRQANGGWTKIEYLDAGSIIQLVSVGCTLRVGDIYRSVEGLM